MDKKRWLLTSIVVAVAICLVDFVGHGLILGDSYTATTALWRPQVEMNKLMPYGWASTIIASLLLVYIYHRGYEGRGSAIAEGLRFGVIIGLYTAVPMALWTYITMPISLNMAISWFVIAMVGLLVAGTITGAMYKVKKI